LVKQFIPKGDDGKQHLKILKDYAIEAGLDVPIYTGTSWGSPIIDD